MSLPAQYCCYLAGSRLPALQLLSQQSSTTMVLCHRSSAHLTMLGPQPLNLSDELLIQGLQTLHVLLFSMLATRQAGQLALQG